MCGIPNCTLLLPHNLQTFHVFAQIFGNAVPVSEHIVAGEESILFLEDETHVVNCVAGCEEGADGGAFCFEDLSVFDGELAWAGLVFVDSGCEAGFVGDQVWYSACVVAVPVG